MSNSSYDENLLIPGSQYTVGTNDGKEFKKVVFVGLRQLNGKPMMVFRTDEDKQVSINPSFLLIFFSISVCVFLLLVLY